MALNLNPFRYLGLRINRFRKRDQARGCRPPVHEVRKGIGTGR